MSQTDKKDTQNPPIKAPSSSPPTPDSQPGMKQDDNKTGSDKPAVKADDRKASGSTPTASSPDDYKR